MLRKKKKLFLKELQPFLRTDHEPFPLFNALEKRSLFFTQNE